jgi:hypothetical protein
MDIERLLLRLNEVVGEDDGRPAQRSEVRRVSTFDGSVGNPRDDNDVALGSSKHVTQCSPHARLSPVGSAANRAPDEAPRCGGRQFGLLEVH